MTGDSTDGCATQYSLVAPSALTAMPEHLSFAEAATLPCAALTSWRALVVECAIKPGDRVLVQGSGGMSLRSEEHTSELQSLMRISYAVFGLKKNKHTT